ncbi:CPBP family intramembrane glutamic endopeptidase [Massilia soli]|uniref:CPBP family intramembrane metalloprotease n=1 Tax=Massilia soli TaxID=2792854 RepID=A0ABS7SPQ7_9BURK|nr:CPBP family intramembrane glutamic endopeptidase [Massilia soli]MBZ2208047.1 CPBP family intramembrane metalloprotease [Massilia soli]
MNAGDATIWRMGANPVAALAAVLMLATAFAAMRAGGVLGPPALRWLLPAGFTLMAAMPWLLMNAEGRRQIGLRRPDCAGAWLPAIALGAAASLACFAIGMALFGRGAENWFVSIANNYRGVMDTTGMSLLTLHLVFTLPALMFSPVAEEIFFRGILQRALEQHVSGRSATLIESAAFGAVHLCHHGLLLEAAGLGWMPLSGSLWMLLMFGTALLFAAIRKRSGSLYPAMAAHAAFNLTMNAAIFWALWP